MIDSNLQWNYNISQGCPTVAKIQTLTFWNSDTVVDLGVKFWGAEWWHANLNSSKLESDMRNSFGSVVGIYLKYSRFIFERNPMSYRDANPFMVALADLA